MVSKHDEMLIYDLRITVLGATTGTNSHPSRDKSKCLSHISDEGTSSGSGLCRQ